MHDLPINFPAVEKTGTEIIRVIALRIRFGLCLACSTPRTAFVVVALAIVYAAFALTIANA
jgi:hypothetical protein